ncbi:MAG: FkbM family methyltransferase [Gammaproteobacteria bacterium]|nr:FkbM family methyltransferase [Gammaproteobacteria bacterium]
MLTQFARNKIRQFLRRFGWVVQRVSSLENARVRNKSERQISKWRFAERYSPHTVLDVGANSGQFAELIRQVLPDARIISFEPLKECYDALVKNPRIGEPFRPLKLALGDQAGFTSINRNTFSPSSSILDMKTIHVHEFPQTRDSMKERIKIDRLDNLRESLEIEEPFIVKIDVQGFEGSVIAGGKKTLRDASAVILEISSYRLYEGAPNFDDLHETMKGLGFRFVGTVDQLRSKADSAILQFDALFESEKFLANERRLES